MAFDTTPILDASSFDVRREADYRLMLPLDQLRDGQHLLTIEAVTKELRVRRDMPFTVRRP